MAKVKQKVWENRCFLNSWDKSCTSYVHWKVSVNPSWRDDNKLYWDAEFNPSKEGTYLWAESKGELRPMQVLQREINKFTDAVEEAIRITEEHNSAASKDTTEDTAS